MKQKHKYSIKVGILGQGVQEIVASAEDTIGGLKTLLKSDFKSARVKELGSSTYRKASMDEKLSNFESVVIVPQVDGGMNC